MYYNYLFLKSGSYLVLGGVPLGESSDGIRIQVAYEEKTLYNQKYYVPISVILKAYEARVSTRILTLNKTNLIDLFHLDNWGNFPSLQHTEPPTFQLVIEGEYINGQYSNLKIIMEKAALVKVDEFGFKKTQETEVGVEFLCLYNTATDRIGVFQWW